MPRNSTVSHDVPHARRKGRVEDFGDLTELDLLELAGNESPWANAPNWHVGFESGDVATFRQMIARTGFEGLGRILDLGCGFGRISMFLAEVNEQVLGIDHNEGGVCIARALASKFDLSNAAFEVGKADAIPAEDESFDGVWIYGVLNYVPRKSCLAECYRVLKPGGRLFVGKYNTVGMILRKYLMDYEKEGASARLTKWADNALRLGPEHDGQPNWGTRETIGDILQAAGFLLDREFGVVVYPQTTLDRREADTYTNHEKLFRALREDDAFVADLLRRKDEILGKLAGDIDVVGIRYTGSRAYGWRRFFRLR